MIVQGNYYTCTVEELAEMVARRICQQNPGETQFNTVNFSLTDYDSTSVIRYTPEEVASDASGWYGIRRIDAGFDDPDLMLCVDYYGGGCASFVHLFDGLTGGEIKEKIQKAMVRTLAIGEGLSVEYVTNSILSAETVYEATDNK